MNRSAFFSSAITLALSALFACSGEGELNNQNDAGAGDAGAQAAESKCKAKHGGEMALLETTLESFCIDKTEVTRGAYREFLAANDVDTSKQPAWCGGVSAQSVDEECQAHLASCSGDACDKLPQTCVNICNAMAYCAWAGKELCGPVGGGGLVERWAQGDEVPALPAMRWLAACGNGLIEQQSGSQTPRTRYPYGDEFQSGLCHDDGDRAKPVGSHPQCVEETGEVLDLAGNVAELNAAVSFQGTGRYSHATAYGGSYNNLFGNNKYSVSCSSATLVSGVTGTQPDVGFRCCMGASSP